MAKAYQMQIQRVSEQKGCRRLIPVGDPVVVEACSEDQAKQKAAKQKLCDPHAKTGGLHKFLVAQANPGLGFLNQYMPFQWFILKGKTAWQ